MENKLISLHKDSRRLVCFLLLVVLIVSMVPMVSYGAGVDGLNSVLIVKDVKITVGGSPIPAEGGTYEPGDRFRMDVDWEILDTRNIVTDSGFNIKMPSIFYFTQTNETGNLKVKIDNVETVVGNYNIVLIGSDFYMQVVFNRDLRHVQSINNGYLWAEGSIKSDAAGDTYEDIEIGGVEIPNITVTEPESGDFYPNGYGKVEIGNFVKYGQSSSSSNRDVNWNIGVNLDEHIKVLNGVKTKAEATGYDPLIITDDLGPDMEFIDYEAGNPVKFSIPICMINPDDDGITNKNLAGDWVSYYLDFNNNPFNINNQIPLVEWNGTDSYQTYYDEIVASDTPCYGIYNKNQLIINLKKLPNTELKMMSWTNFQGILSEKPDILFANHFNLSQELQDKIWEAFETSYKRLFDTPGPSGYMTAVGMQIGVKTKYTGTIPTNGQVPVSNVAKIVGKTGTATSNTVQIQSIGGGAEGLSSGEVELVKYSSGTSIAISDAAFQLMVKDGQNFISEGGIKYTGSDGVILWKGLTPGKTYKFVEVGKVKGYYPDRISFDAEVSTISDSGEFTLGTDGMRFSAYNERLPGELEFTKVSEGNSKLSGGVFKIESSDGSFSATTTAIDGEITFGGLEWGEYTFTEEKAPDGYDKKTIRYTENSSNFDADDETFVIDQDNLKATATASNALVREITVMKYDGQESQITPLSGGVFELVKKSDHDTVIATTSAVDGMIYFSGMTNDTYNVIEREAPDGYDKDSFTYAGDFNGDFIVGSTTPAYVQSALNDKLKGSLTLNKVDSVGNPLNGGVFKLSWNDGADQSTTKSAIDGVVSFSGLAWGDYKIEELEAPESYDAKSLKLETTNTAFDTSEGTFTVTGNALNFTVKAVNAGLPGEFELTKVDSEGNLLEGGVFKIVSSDGQFTATKAAVDGKVTFGGLDWDTYTLTEEEAPEGYDKDKLVLKSSNAAFDAANKEFTITGTSLKVAATAVNKELPGSLTLIKADAEDSGTKLSGAAFSLEYLSGSAWVAYTESGTKVINETNSEGIVTFDGLDWGSYRFVEEKAASGYDKNSFKIKQDTEFVSTSEVTIVIDETKRNYELNAQNAVLLGSLTVHKIDGDTELALPGVKFKLQVSSGGIWEDYLVGGQVYTLSTGANGEVTFNDLPLGTYRVVELEAPKGYDGKIRYSDDGGIMVITEDNLDPTMTAFNDKILGKVQLTKLDSTNNKALQGAEFSLQVKNNGIWMKYAGQKTDSNGVIKFENLPWGEYRFVENAAPSGYDKTTLKFTKGDGTFTVNGNTQSFTMTATNDRLKGRAVIDKFDNANRTSPLQGTEFTLMVKKNGSWVDYKVKGKTVKVTTNKAGRAIFSDLPWGTYKIIETNASFGFDKDTLKFKNGKNTFTVNGKTQKLSIVAYNTAHAYDDDWNPVTDPAELANVLGEEAYKDLYGDLPEGYVKGQESKTYDLTHVVPLLVMMMAAAVFFLIAQRLKMKKD